MFSQVCPGISAKNYLHYSYFLLAVIFSCQIRHGFAQCENLIVNPYFNNNNNDFTSGYTYQLPLPNAVWNPQTYTIARDANTVHDNFVGVDHTSGNGLFLIANGAEEELNVWCQEILRIEPNTNYILSVWISPLNNLPFTTIQFTVNGQKIGNPFDGPDGTNEWIQYEVEWNSGNNNQIDLCIVSFNNDAIDNGNDFGLDDVSMTCCIAEIDAGEDMSICRGSSAQLEATEGAVTYRWEPDASLDDPTVFDPIATPDQTTTYTVFADFGDCEAQDEVTVTVNYVEATVSEDTAICLGETVRLVAAGGDAYSWDPIKWLSSPISPTPEATPEETITYTVIVEKNNCADEKEVTITIKDPFADAGEDEEVCNKGTVQLEATGGVEYLWSPAAWLSATDIANPECTPKATITYTVFAKDGLCEAFDTVTVYVRKVAAKFSADSVCLGEFTSFLNLSTGSDSTLLKWEWEFGDGEGSEEENPQHIFDVDGTHEVELTTKLGKCKSRKKMEVIVYPLPFADFDADSWNGTSENPLFTFYDLSRDGIIGRWKFNDGSPDEDYVPGEDITHLFKEPDDNVGPYKYEVNLEIENEFGCKADTSHIVEIEPIWSFFVPNAFTPNGDGFNDQFLPVSNGIRVFDMKIFNRWGELVFRTNDPNYGWEGKSKKGKLLESGIYNWIIEFENNFGDKKNYKGHVSLLR